MSCAATDTPGAAVPASEVVVEGPLVWVAVPGTVVVVASTAAVVLVVEEVAGVLATVVVEVVVVLVLVVVVVVVVLVVVVLVVVVVVVVTGGTVTGGSVMGGIVTGGSVMGGTVTGSTVMGGTVTGGSVTGGRVMGGSVMGGTVVLVFVVVVVGRSVVLVLVVVGRSVVLVLVLVVGATVVDVDVVGTGAHAGTVTVLESRVTAAFRASSRPCTWALVLAVIAVRARTVPMKVEFTPSVAELPTCQKTLHAWAPLISTTRLSGAVIKVEPAWKMKTASGLPWASRVSVPVMAKESAL